MINKIIRIIRDPIFLFFILGSLLYLFYSAATNYYNKKNNQIIISASQVELLKDSFEKTWNRTATETELKTLIENYIKDEVFYREAVSMGLDKSDLAIKRRLRQIMELLMDDYSSVIPSEDQLQKFLSERPEDFQLDPTISFTHHYFSMDAKDEALNQLSLLHKGLIIDNKNRKKLSFIPDHFENERRSEVSHQFGDLFASQVFDIKTDTWLGPLESAYGWHLVKVSNQSPGLVPPLNEIWDQVEREWSRIKKKEKKEEQFQKMRERYAISVEKTNEDY